MANWTQAGHRTQTAPCVPASSCVQIAIWTQQVIFRFERLNASEEEVMGLFQRQPTLEVVLLTESGGKNKPIEGIVTQWDAARYPNGENG